MKGFFLKNPVLGMVSSLNSKFLPLLLKKVSFRSDSPEGQNPHVLGLPQKMNNPSGKEPGVYKSQTNVQSGKKSLKWSEIVLGFFNDLGPSPCFVCLCPNESMYLKQWWKTFRPVLSNSKVNQEISGKFLGKPRELSQLHARRDYSLRYTVN